MEISTELNINNTTTWCNIFDHDKLVKYRPDYYLIKYNSMNQCYMTDSIGTIIENPHEIINKHNIFTGENIVVDIDSFINEGINNRGKICYIIANAFHIRYVNKILIKKDLQFKDLKEFIEKSHCKFIELTRNKKDLDKEIYIIEFFDNFGKYHKLNVSFSSEYPTSVFTISDS